VTICNAQSSKLPKIRAGTPIEVVVGGSPGCGGRWKQAIPLTLLTGTRRSSSERCPLLCRFRASVDGSLDNNLAGDGLHTVLRDTFTVGIHPGECTDRLNTLPLLFVLILQERNAIRSASPVGGSGSSWPSK
jgi:hypothetical protein